MEIRELFEDITLEDVVTNKACVEKVIGCKDMPASVVKTILSGVWRRLGPWRMKKCKNGVLGFFFEHEDDCSYVLQKRPWLVNGVLLNIKPWPGEGKKIGSFVEVDGKRKAELVRRGYLRIWIDVWVSHSISARFFLTADGKSESLVQIKYEKLPMLLILGKAIVSTQRGNEFSRCLWIEGTPPEWELNGRNRRGLWKQRTVVKSRSTTGGESTGIGEKTVVVKAPALSCHVKDKVSGEKDNH
ncbi:hypothetical protein F8388_014317 [Cannabis sativa]|uniref:DUF4283 domain-containing protein n=1 Tax=Cannabis sativa TaxID=3483 RepID=A0A7J6GQH5_CANSA|nr:hypothetical protein F8388_014317 [Cannabis sativa]